MTIKTRFHLCLTVCFCRAGAVVRALITQSKVLNEKVEFALFWGSTSGT